MKRSGQLFGSICDFENLWEAARRARRGKKYRPDVLAFHYDLESNLLSLREDLISRRYTPGAYRTFRIRDPKPRLISAAPYRDRVVHHALCRVIEPIFERGFIYDSYANRMGKGTHRALNRCTYYCRRFTHVLKCDIAKYFPSCDHEVLLEEVARKIKCADTLWLIGRIVESSNPQEEVAHYFPGDDLFTPFERRHGIPIGNLTSQLMSNVMLNPFDHFVKERLRQRAYVRFADDFLIFSNDKKGLLELPDVLQTFLDRYRLRLHPAKCQVVPCRCGVDFLGWNVFRGHRRLRRATGVRFQRRLRSLQRQFAEGVISFQDVNASVQSWVGHLSHGDTWGLRRRILEQASFVRNRPIQHDIPPPSMEYYSSKKEVRSGKQEKRSKILFLSSQVPDYVIS